MKTVTSFTRNLAAAMLIVIATIAAAAAGTDTCVGAGATIGGTCTPLENTASVFNRNTAVGADALANDSSGGANNATGASALQANTTGAINTADRQNALGSNSTGSGNTATGVSVLVHTTTGSSNIAIGSGAGNNLTTDDNNIDIGNEGVAGEDNTVRIGTQGAQIDTFIAGIFGTPEIKKACEVVVEKTGLLGCVKSSARYKRDIRDMGDASDKLMKLRPVTFSYKADSTGIQQYGLIAEEVEKVYKIEKFRYGTLGPKVMTSGLEKFLPYSGSLSKAFGVGAPDAAS
ncbi:MAG: tail fiber domain-containing protein [Candidatus Binataceae bacterium]|jgi:hypothetical protein